MEDLPVPCLFHGIENICYVQRLESRNIENLSNPNLGQITGLSVRDGKRWGGEELGWFSRDGTLLVRSGQETPLPLALQGIEDTVMDVSSNSLTHKILFKPAVQRNQRLTRG